MTKMLSQLLPSFKNQVVAVDGSIIEDLSQINNISISSLVFDSRKVNKNSLFFALPGTHTDGNNFIANAILNGANAVVFQGELNDLQKEQIACAIIKRSIENEISDESLKFSPVLIKVENSRYAMAPLSARFFDNPSERLIVIGVTGTEGKSSTVSFIWQLLKACGFKAGFISTVEYSYGDEAIPNPEHQTTPESPIIQNNLNEMLLNGCKFAVIETSSHGLSEKLNRCGNISFDVGIFMNVTLEHLEFHKNFETYRNDKANLFRILDKVNHTKMIAGEKITINSLGIVNLEDESSDFFVNSTKQKVIGFTTKQEEYKIPFLYAKNVESSSKDINFEVESHIDNTNDFFVKANLPGAYNSYNLMASILAVSNVTGISFEEIAQKTENLRPITGRMTEIDEGQDFEVIVDYAHTPSSFKTIFPPIKNRCKGKLIAVFGSAGERDTTKRALQGEIASEFCDFIILTDEDPRGENSMEILKMIYDGVFKQNKIIDENVFLIPNRENAIKKAFEIAQKDDIVLLLGKGHENSIIYKDFVMPYDESSMARKLLKCK